MPRTNRVAGPRKRKWTNRDGSVSAAWRIDYYDLQGRRHRPQFDSRAAADAEKTRIELLLRGGSFIHDAASATVKQAAERWLLFIDTRRERPLEASTRKTYREEVELHLLDTAREADGTVIGIGHLKLTRLTPVILEDLKERLLRNGRSADMVGRVFKRLRSILKWAQLRQLIGSNPAQDVRVLRGEREDDAVEIPALHELRAMLQYFRDRRAADGIARLGPDFTEAFVVTALSSGFRSSELRGLSDAGIGAGCRTITALQRADRYNTIGRVKSRAAYRTVDLGPEAAATLQRWLRLRPKSDRGLVFPTGSGTVEGYANILHRVWTPFMQALHLVAAAPVPDEAGRPRIDPQTGACLVQYKPKYGLHALRHGAVSLRIATGWTPKRIQVFAGHSSIKTTMDIYGHLWRDEREDQDRAAAVERLLLG